MDAREQSAFTGDNSQQRANVPRAHKLKPKPLLRRPVIISTEIVVCSPAQVCQ